MSDIQDELPLVLNLTGIAVADLNVGAPYPPAVEPEIGVKGKPAIHQEPPPPLALATTISNHLSRGLC